MLFASYDVFLSYSRADAERVKALRDELRRLGYRVFFDVQSIDPGQQWKRRLEHAIRRSRTLVLCWSERAKGSDYITFEYSRAEALGKPIYPWLLDTIPLPAMLEIQGIPHSDPVQVAAALRPALGWTLGNRRALHLILALATVAGIAVSLWLILKPPPPPPPWEFQGEVIDPATRLGIAGVEVDATPEHGATLVTHTDDSGRFDLHLPAPQSKTVHLIFRKAGFVGEQVNVPSGKPFTTDLDKQH